MDHEPITLLQQLSAHSNSVSPVISQASTSTPDYVDPDSCNFIWKYFCVYLKSKKLLLKIPLSYL